MRRGAKPLPPERAAVIEACIADGWPLIQISRTHRIGWDSLRALYPDYRGMPRMEAAKLGASARRTTLELRKARP